jgi:hypothetical protein
MSILYILKSPATGLMKVGVAENMYSRMAAYKTHSADALEVWLEFECGGRKNAERVERDILTRFSGLVEHGEWLRPTPEFLRAAVVFPDFYSAPMDDRLGASGFSVYRLFCIRCEKTFNSGKKSPKRCALCGSVLWNSPRVRLPGAGRPVRVPVGKVSANEVEERSDGKSTGGVDGRGSGEVLEASGAGLVDEGVLGVGGGGRGEGGGSGEAGGRSGGGVAEAGGGEGGVGRRGSMKRVMVKTRVERVGEGDLVKDPEVW